MDSTTANGLVERLRQEISLIDEHVALDHVTMDDAGLTFINPKDKKFWIRFIHSLSLPADHQNITIMIYALMNNRQALHRKQIVRSPFHLFSYIGYITGTNPKERSVLSDNAIIDYLDSSQEPYSIYCEIGNKDVIPGFTVYTPLLIVPDADVKPSSVSIWQRKNQYKERIQNKPK